MKSFVIVTMMGLIVAGEVMCDDFFLLQDIQNKENKFIIKADLPEVVRDADEAIRTGKQKMAIGIICKSKAPYNPDWSYHFDPKAVYFTDASLEGCDAAMTYLEEHLDEAGGAFLPGNKWCPWGSVLAGRVYAPSEMPYLWSKIG